MARRGLGTCLTSHSTSVPSWTGTQSSCHPSLWLHPQGPFPEPSFRYVTGAGKGEAWAQEGPLASTCCACIMSGGPGGQGRELHEERGLSPRDQGDRPRS